GGRPTPSSSSTSWRTSRPRPVSCGCSGRLAADGFGICWTKPTPPGWSRSDVLGLAQGIYEDRAFDRLPLLADALMDAGCDEEEILTHCRSDGPHVLGCWVVDLLLAKE